MIKVLNYLSNKQSLYETIIVSANDALVDLYLKKRIKFVDIHKKLFDYSIEIMNLFQLAFHWPK